MKRRKTVEELKEQAARYRRFYPERYANMDDLAILLTVGAISTPRDIARFTEPERIHAAMTGERPYKLPRIPRFRKREAKPRVRPYTANQIAKMCRDAMKDLRADHCIPEIDVDPGWEESVAFDMAQGMILTDERIQEYFRRSGVERRFWAESLADYFV